MFDPDQPDVRPASLDLMHELRVCEELSHSLHPNDAVIWAIYRLLTGSVFLASALSGIKLLSTTLFRRKSLPIRRLSLMVFAAASNTFIRSVMRTSNDINPGNIMLDDNVHPGFIDFDSCEKVGESVKDRKVLTEG
ncbi:Pc22g01860 protein [Mycena sanguinolenta]|uniref:Pc22g01860 protein n=1 Tax=Mycena sanguinolenta TaxID=230812 RepID=A0A8H6YC97_9AGAR|nr:Pc22g01860 protein [Mycena sanguinolenta]